MEAVSAALDAGAPEGTIVSAEADLGGVSGGTLCL